MKKKIAIIIIVFVAVSAGFVLATSDSGKKSVSAVSDALTDRMEQMINGGSKFDIASKDEVNVLLIGLDSRAGWKKAHCDANHMFTLNIKNKTLTITSVPRGTYVFIPGGPYEATEYYLANSCELVGVEYGAAQVEKIVGKQADFRVYAGFSQTMGVLRALGMPAPEAMQWLRYRHGYAIGEPQRSANQAVFMKDMVVKYLPKFESEFSIPFQFALFSIVDTDMDFATARALLAFAYSADFDKHPEKIFIAMKPEYETAEFHFDPEKTALELERARGYLQPLLPSDDLSGKSLEEIQSQLADYLRSALNSNDPIDDIMRKKIWLQVENSAVREELHFAFIERWANENPSDAEDLIVKYIMEMQVAGEQDYEKKGRELLEKIMLR
ncbi:MAG: hypothetical protein ACD_76C00052G0003 [uncultured bacterium]|nr:MAG: hypothetical protein ACD_76C00052G0003 [uncultured bacterium]HBD04872.1 hypothetical protein [Candidatus Uhrbacteria bacterium]